jgi:hypothetical protein
MGSVIAYSSSRRLFYNGHKFTFNLVFIRGCNVVVAHSYGGTAINDPLHGLAKQEREASIYQVVSFD